MRYICDSAAPDCGRQISANLPNAGAWVGVEIERCAGRRTADGARAHSVWAYGSVCLFASEDEAKVWRDAGPDTCTCGAQVERTIDFRERPTDYTRVGARALGLETVDAFVRLAYERETNPLPTLRRVYPHLMFQFAREKPSDDADSLPVKGGWVVITGA
jgi:hypothetical protein